MKGEGGEGRGEGGREGELASEGLANGVRWRIIGWSRAPYEVSPSLSPAVL